MKPLTLILPTTALLSALACFAAQQTQPDILETLRSTRANSFKSILSGRAVAQIEVTEKGQPITPRHRVEFAFDGPNSIWKEYDPEDPKKIVMAVLETKDRQITLRAGFRPGRGQIPNSVSVRPISKTLSTADLSPPIWNHREFARIPGIFGDEDQFFTKWSPKPFASTIKNDSTTVVTIDFPFEPGNSGEMNAEKAMITFDMDLGGRVTRYEYLHDMGQGDKHRKSVSTVTNTWRKSGETYVPSSRVVDYKCDYAGGAREEFHSRIDFSEFTLGPVNPEDFQVKALGIAPDTIVIDEVSKTQYLFSDDKIEKMLGSAPITQEQ